MGTIDSKITEKLEEYGFSLEDLQREMSGHILDSAFIEGIYKN